MADDDSTDDTESGPSYTEQYRYLAGVGPQPKTKKKKATSLPYAPTTADRPDATGSSDADTADTGDWSGKDYRFTAVTSNPYGDVQDYSAADPNATITGVGQAEAEGPVAGVQPKNEMSRQLELLLGGTQNAQDLSPHEYDKLTQLAHGGNKLAQQILVKGKFQDKDYPSLQQDLSKVEDPFVKALSGLPALAENLQGQQTQVTQPYDFSNAEAQVNNLLGQMGSTQQMSANPETQGYVNSLQNIVAGTGNLNNSVAGLPSIMSALGQLGPAAKESETASPYASLLAALLSHQQYETIYGGEAPSSTGDPAWLQQLIASVTGQAVGGGLVSPTVAAGGVGTTPSTSATPTGSNA